MKKKLKSRNRLLQNDNGRRYCLLLGIEPLLPRLDGFGWFVVFNCSRVGPAPFHDFTAIPFTPVAHLFAPLLAAGFRRGVPAVFH